jgi:hypothetical protein
MQSSLCCAAAVLAHAAGAFPAAPDGVPLVHPVPQRRDLGNLEMLDRELVGREASPSAAIIDSQSVKTTEAGGPRGYDAGKKINGRKRHAMVDTDGRSVMLQVYPASVQDRDGEGVARSSVYRLIS